MGLGGALPAMAEDAPLSTLTVKGQALAASQAAFSTQQLTQHDIASQPVQEVEALWRQVPGMHVNHYQLGGVANSVVLRGFGSGGHGGDVAATLDGISLNEAMSHADGYFDMNVVVPLEVETVTVSKGPVSVLQGNFNRAGLLALQTRRSGTYTEAQLQAGSHGTYDLQAALGRQLGADDQIFLAAQAHHTDGARPHSNARHHTVSGRWHHRVDSRLDFALSARWHEARANSAGYLTEAQWKQDPQGKDPRADNDGADKSFGTLRLDVNYALSDTTQLLAFAYGTQQDFVRWFSRGASIVPIWRQREEAYDRSVQGTGLQLSGTQALAGAPLEWLVGSEYVQERTDYGYWENTHHRRRTSVADSDRRTTLDTASAYAQAHWKVARWFQPSVGVRWDRFAGDCRVRGAETGGNPCSRMARVAHASPKLGVSSEIAQGATLRASWSEGFALPSDFAKYALGAAHLDPNVFRQTEVGLQWAAHSSLWLDVALYRITSSHEIRNTAPGEYDNVGATRRTGAELQVHWTPTARLELQWAYGRMASTVTQNANPSVLGQHVTGVPRYTSTLQASYQPAAEWTLHAAWRHVGRSAVDAANTQWSGRYHVGDVGVQYLLPRSLGLGNAQLSLWVRNVTDQKYASSTSSVGIAPGAPRTVMASVKVAL